MSTIVPRFAAARVLIAGDVMLDRYWSGDAERVSPEAPVPVVRVRATEERPGGAANVALNVAALGGRATLLGLAGEDDEATQIRTRLAAAGVSCGLLRLAGCRTIVKLRVLSRHQQLLRLDFEAAFSAGQSALLLEPLHEALAAADVLVLSDYAKGTLAQAGAMIAAAQSAGVPVLVDPKGRDFARYRGATLLTPNVQEFDAVAGAHASEQDLEERARAMLRELAIGALLITRGERGMTLVPAAGEALHLPARALEVYDVTGAGDTVIGTVAAALAAGEDMAAAVALANVAAGIVVGRSGAATVGAAELAGALAQGHGAGFGVLDEEQLLAALAAARARGERIVMTNGCFDLLHAGHVMCLDAARALGDRLVVAVNSDASVARLKGPGRPVTPLARRMAVLAGLKSVDWVVGFDDATPERLLATVRPDVLAKGGDYRPEEVVGRELVEGYGGEVRVLGYLEGCSSSALIERSADGRGGA
jgi:D-beta-D-heptose 7-phosphate kinase/D-beta-D-heptose 1-phosphate adenosyltransferase